MNTKIKYGLKELKRDFGEMTFGRLLKTHRLCEELTQTEMADLLGVSKQAICDLEKGRKLPSLERAYKIALKLGMKPESFVNIAVKDYFRELNLPFDKDTKKRAA